MPDDSRKSGAGRRDKRQAGLAPGAAQAIIVAELYGHGLADTLRDKLVAQLTSLMAIMPSATFHPTFSYVYDHHRTARIRLNAATVDIDTVDVGEPIGGAVSQTLVCYEITASIRIHTAYAGGFLDSRDTTKLLQSISNWLHEHRDLGDNFRLTTTGPMKPRMAFEESPTLGGELIVIVEIYQEYTLS